MNNQDKSRYLIEALMLNEAAMFRGNVNCMQELALIEASKAIVKELRSIDDNWLEEVMQARAIRSQYLNNVIREFN